jgi:hypothetical protein
VKQKTKGEQMHTLDVTDEQLGTLYAFAYERLVDDTDGLYWLLNDAVVNGLGIGVRNAIANMETKDFVSYRDVAKTIAEANIPPLPDDAKTMTFRYNNSERVVMNPEISGAVLGGVEYTRDGVYTGQFKNYRLDRINQ